MKLSKVLAAVCCLSCSLLVAQPFGNEWIDFGQQYFSFPITTTGVYKIDFNTLQSAGVPVSTIDPRQLQVYGRGQQVYIHVEGESDGSFDAADYIEFYAQKNDGWADAHLYGGEPANPYFSLINDTARYYLTWANSPTPLRFQPETDINYGAYSAAGFVFKENIVERANVYFDGKTTSGATEVDYVESEGWFDGGYSLGRTVNVDIPSRKAYTTGPAALLSWRVVGASDYRQLAIDHHLVVDFAGTSFDTLYAGYDVIDKSYAVSPSALGSNTTRYSYRSVNDLGSGADRGTAAYIILKYAHQMDFDAQTEFPFWVQDQSGQTKSYLAFTNFSASGAVWVYDLTNHKRVLVTSANDHRALIPNSGGQKFCVAFSDGNLRSINQLNPVNGNGLFNDHAANPMDSALIMITHSNLKNSVEQYANYRRTQGHQVLVVDVDELYEQYAWGIRKSPLAIRHFIDYLIDQWNDPPANMFLIGKSVKAKLHRKNNTQYQRCLVPSYGNPASDVRLTSGLNNTLLEPAVSTGRLSALTSDHVLDYLDKVMEYESNTEEEWMKTILHFAGGGNKSESDRFTGYLDSYANLLEDTLFGGNTFTFRKFTTDPIQTSLSDSIELLINQGASFMTFFGHASTTGGFDQNIDDPSFYNNKGKYPLIVGNSCFTGDIHEASGESTSEDFVLIKDKGSIAFIASVDLGFESFLNQYSWHLFRNIGQTNYGGGLGASMANTIRSIQGNGQNFYLRKVALEMTLHGDPLVEINPHDLPDYVIEPSSVRFDPSSEATTEIDSFDIYIEMTNIGRAINVPLGLVVVRQFPDPAVPDTTYEFTLPPLKYKNEFRLRLPIDPINGPGMNWFKVILDPFSIVDELSEFNNEVNVPYFIRSGDIVPVLPYPYAMIGAQEVTLKASTGYAYEKVQDYIFEIDTTDLFDSPSKQSMTLTSGGGVVEWQPELTRNMAPDRAYFWRVRNKNSSHPNPWKESSFQYVPGKWGWSQDHFFQFKNDDFRFLDYDRGQRKFTFVPSVRQLSCQTISTTTISKLFNVLYKIDSELQEVGGCSLASAIHVAVLDSLTFVPWGTPFQGQNPNNDFGQLNKNGNCGKNRVQKFFIFQANNASQLAGLQDMLANKVPKGNFILAWTWVRNDFSRWDALAPGLKQTFVDLGADSITSISNDSLPYIFFVKKGHKSTAKEVLGTKYDEQIELKTPIANNSTYGFITSTQIGPALAWDSLLWDHYSPGVAGVDEISLNLFGEKGQDHSDLLIADIDQNTTELDISGQANANEYQYLRLNAYLEDDSLQTAPQLDKWQIVYEGVPEAALNATLKFEFYKDTVQEGEHVRFAVAVQNISNRDMDSLLIAYYVVDQNRKVISIPYPRQAPLKADSVLISEVEFSTFGMAGHNTLVIEVNPNNDQPEQTHFNNIGQLPFTVLRDNINPLLDVTFDGVHILNGDIVSAEPEIVMQLADDNEFLALNDTSDFKVWLSTPGAAEQRVWFEQGGRQVLDFIPGQTSNNKARIIYHPKFRVDGNYKLRVQATDRSSNESGLVDYHITFEVINRSTITNLMNYPNPFTTSTRFVFTLTGSKVPDAMQIQIMTISGKVVKTIDMHELGPIRVGRNITEYAWDGRDEFGDRLANGVYLYKVETRLEGGSIEHRESGADKYFKKGFGKMYLMK